MGVFVCISRVCFFCLNLPKTKIYLAPIVVVCLLVHGTAADAQLVINELYYDHPGSDDGYEFVELMNVSGDTVLSSTIALEFHNGAGTGWETIWDGTAGAAGEVRAYPVMAAIGPGELFVIGGRHVTPLPGAVAGFSLQNGPDALRVTVGAIATDVVAYGGLADVLYAEGASAPGVDAGHSLARVPDGNDTNDNAADFSDVTPSPGAYNVPRRDAALSVSGATRLAAVLAEDGREVLGVELANNGAHDIGRGEVSVSVWDSSGVSCVLVDRFVTTETLLPGGRTLFAIEVTLGPGYHRVIVRLGYAPDERAANNTLVLMRRVGGPPLMISELLCYPQDGCPQFVEVFNAGAEAVDISGFLMRDKSHVPTLITGGPASVAPSGYLVVTPDAAQLLRFFPGTPSGLVLQYEGTWPTLNRTGSGEVSDSVVITDALELPVEAIAYPPVDSDYRGRSLERVDLFTGRVSQTWVLSNDPRGASPGRRNARSLFEPPVPGRLEIRPTTFSPYTGETMTVFVDFPAGVRAVASVYDVGGRCLIELGSAAVAPAVYIWDGRDANGRCLEPGIYIVVCELIGAGGGRLDVHKVVVGCGRRGR